MGGESGETVLPKDSGHLESDVNRNELEEKKIQTQNRGGKDDEILQHDFSDEEDDLSFYTGFVESLILIFLSEFGDRVSNLFYSLFYYE